MFPTYCWPHSELTQGCKPAENHWFFLLLLFSFKSLFPRLSTCSSSLRGWDEHGQTKESRSRWLGSQGKRRDCRSHDTNLTCCSALLQTQFKSPCVLFVVQMNQFLPAYCNNLKSGKSLGENRLGCYKLLWSLFFFSAGHSWTWDLKLLSCWLFQD